jgi:predicted phosphoribosyltransferase
MRLFRDRLHAGRALARKLLQYANRSDVIVVGLPPDAIPVAYEVARKLHAPLDVFLVRALGPVDSQRPAMGVIASGGLRVLNGDMIPVDGIHQTELDILTFHELEELGVHERKYRGNQPAGNLAGHTVILVDDGFTDRAALRAAIRALRTNGPTRLVVAVPAGSPATCAEFQKEADEVLYAANHESFAATGTWYDDFSEITDDEVRMYLYNANKGPRTGRAAT